jgi:hypothetical protein
MHIFTTTMSTKGTRIEEAQLHKNIAMLKNQVLLAVGATLVIPVSHSYLCNSSSIGFLYKYVTYSAIAATSFLYIQADSRANHGMMMFLSYVEFLVFKWNQTTRETPHL